MDFDVRLHSLVASFALALTALTLAACGGIAVRSRCSEDGQCSGQERCVAGECQGSGTGGGSACDPLVESCPESHSECNGRAEGQPDWCVEPFCGDGKLNDPAEECDDGNASSNDDCVSCKAARCGDGAVWQSVEQCDDGNTSTGDGCGECARIAHVSLGAEHSCSLDSAGRVKCWGHNEGGVLGIGESLEIGLDLTSWGDDPDEMGTHLPPLELGEERRAESLAVGGYHACAVLDGQQVKCWGFNGSGRLGLGNLLSRGAQQEHMGDDLPVIDLGTGRSAVALAAGDAHTCALLDDHSVKCWGENEGGRLGVGDTEDRGDEAFEMGDALPAVALGPGRTAKALALGAEHTCALLDDDSLKCWGSNQYGQLGQGDTLDRGDDPSELGAPLHPVDLGVGRTARAVTAGARHTCALLDDASVKCWGANQYGELGLGASAGRGDHLNAGKLDLVPVDFGAVSAALAIGAGKHHTCVLLEGGSVKCWGANGKGQLGVGYLFGALGDLSGEMGDGLPRVELGAGRSVKALAVGQFHSCVLRGDDTLKCWGDNEYGQLGLGNVRRRGGPNTMGDNLPVVALP